MIFDSAFVAFAVCMLSIPFVSFFSGGISIGFGIAVVADSGFKGVFVAHRVLR
jgi:hypothetical protein